MKMLKFYSFSLLILFSLALLSCSKDKDKETPSNVIEDAAGVKIDLVWSTGGTTTTAKAEADLDLYLLKGTTEISVSDKMDNFESINFSNSLADSDYTVNVEYFEGSKNVQYDVNITGISSNKSYKVSSQFSSTDASTMKVDVLKIIKKGSVYTINKL